MPQSYERLFQNLEQLDPPPQLLGAIILRAKSEQIRAARVWLTLWVVVALSAFTALIPAFQYTAKEFYQSGFYQYLLLIFSDSGLVMTYWKEFVMTLAESLPLLGVAIFLFFMLILLGSFRLAIKNLKTLSLFTQ